jgi:AcrR family transcriptional regulator
MSSEPTVPARPTAGVPLRDLPAVPTEVLRLARRRVRRGEHLEMSSLAAELGVNRVTLYRWVGSRERLLVEVLWSLADEALGVVRSQVPPGPHRAVEVVVGFLELVLANPGMQHLLATDIELTMRLLTHQAAGFQPRLLAAVEDLLREETATGRLDVPMDPHELAYVVVRVIESYTYLDVLLGEQPEARRAEAVLRLLLGSRGV